MAGLFGPQSSSTSSHVQSICDTLEIPHIETRWDYRMKREDYSVNLYPHPHALGQVRRGFFLIYGSFLFCCQCCQICISSLRHTRSKSQQPFTIYVFVQLATLLSVICRQRPCSAAACAVPHRLVCALD